MKLRTLIKAIILIARNPKEYSEESGYIHSLTGEVKEHFWQIDSKHYVPCKLWEAYMNSKESN